jgi:hypothetical protein
MPAGERLCEDRDVHREPPQPAQDLIPGSYIPYPAQEASKEISENQRSCRTVSRKYRKCREIEESHLGTG